MKKRKLPPEFVEKWVCDYFRRPVEATRSCSMFAKDRIMRGVLFVMLREFGYRDYREIGLAYYITPSTVCNEATAAKERYKDQIERIRLELNNYADATASKD